MEKIYLSDFYNHSKMLKDAKDGDRIIRKSNRELWTYKKERVDAVKNKKVGDVLNLKMYIFNLEIIEISNDGILTVQPISRKTGKKLKKSSFWINPLNL